MYNSQGSQNQADQTSNFFWLIVLVFGIILAIWFFAQEYIVTPILWVRLAEIDALRHLAEWWTPVVQYLHLPVPDLKKLNAIENFIQTADPKAITWENFATLNVLMGHWVRYPLIVILLVLAFVAFFHGGEQFRRVYDMKTLRQADETVWPQTKVTRTIDLIQVDIDEGPWAMAKTPLNFCRENNLTVTTMIAGKKVWSLNEKAAYRLIALQIGPLWNGLENLPMHAKAIALICLLRATSERELAKKLIFQFSESASAGNIDFTGVPENIKRFYQHKIVRFLEMRHAYVFTFMASLLEIGRSDGVLASAEFLWLKPMDRRLWYVLNNVGRRTAFVEVAGAVAHWYVEKKVGRALKTPVVKCAVDALTESLQNILVIDEGERWHTIKEG